MTFTPEMSWRLVFVPAVAFLASLVWMAFA